MLNVYLLQEQYLQLDGREQSRQGINRRPRVFIQQHLYSMLRILLFSKLFQSLIGWEKGKPTGQQGKTFSSGCFRGSKLQQMHRHTPHTYLYMRFPQIPLWKEPDKHFHSSLSLNTVFLWEPFCFSLEFQQNIESIPHPLPTKSQLI